MSDQFQHLAQSELIAALRGAGDAALTPERRVHAARTGMKRLRAVLRLARPAFAGFADENRIARDLAAQLSPLRDAAVLRSTLASLIEETGRKPGGSEALALIIDSRFPSAAMQQAALDVFVEAASSMLERAGHWQLPPDEFAVFVEGATDTYRRGRRAMRVAGRSGSPEHFHEWRKQAKYHMYQAQLLAGPQFPRIVSARQISRLAELLGLHHDREVFRDFLAAQPDRRRPTRLERAARDSQARLEHEAFVLGARVFRRKPDKWRAALQRRAARLPADPASPGDNA